MRDRFGGAPLSTPSRTTASPRRRCSRGRSSPTSHGRLILDAVTTFAAIGYYLEADTPFRDVRALTPGATLRWRPGRLEVTGRPPTFEMRPMERSEIRAGFLETPAQRSLAASLPGAIASGSCRSAVGGTLATCSTSSFDRAIHRRSASRRVTTLGSAEGKSRRRAAGVRATLGIRAPGRRRAALSGGGRAAEEHDHRLPFRRALVEPARG